MYCNTVYVKQFVNLYFLTKYSMDFKLLKWIFQLLQEKYDKLELDFDSKTKESESYRLDLENVISELAQVKETMASSKEDKGQLTKELDRLKGEVKVSVGQRWRSDYLVVLVKMYCIYETENNFSWSKFMIIIFINNYCAIWKSMNYEHFFWWWISETRRGHCRIERKAVICWERERGLQNPERRSAEGQATGKALIMQ